MQLRVSDDTQPIDEGEQGKEKREMDGEKKAIVKQGKESLDVGTVIGKGIRKLIVGR